MDVEAVFITGTVGAGKTSVADALGDLLGRAGIPYAVIDVDWLRRSWPCPPDDPFNNGMALRNLRAVAANFVEAGALRVVVAGVLENASERAAYQAALGVPLTVGRLALDLATVRQRLRRRHENDDGLRWHLARAGELDEILERARVEDFVIDVGDRSTDEVAQAIRTAINW